MAMYAGKRISIAIQVMAKSQQKMINAYQMMASVRECIVNATQLALDAWATMADAETKAMAAAAWGKMRTVRSKKNGTQHGAVCSCLSGDIQKQQPAPARDRLLAENAWLIPRSPFC
jgi:hypothetical protein